VQEASLLVFRKFLELGTVRQTLLWFLEHGLQFPVYTRKARPVETAFLRNDLSNSDQPDLWRCYAYGKTEHTLRYENGEPHRGIQRKPKEQWLALLPNSHEGYVSWEQYQQIQQTIAENVRGSGPSGAVKAVPLCWPVCCVAGGVVVSSPCLHWQPP